MKKQTIILLSLLTLALNSVFALDIKVLITEAKAPYTLSFNSSYEIINAKFESLIKSADKGSVQFEVAGAGVRVDGEGVYSAGVIAKSKGRIILNSNEYDGRFLVTVYEGELKMINIVDLEDYVAGVLPYEMSPSKPIEALKAQAAAARSYAMYHYLVNKELGKDRPYDVDNTTKYQVYRGTEKVNEKVRKAVAETKGKVLTFEERIIAAFFHGGGATHTESAFRTFGVDIPYLRGVSCPYSFRKRKRWELSIELGELSKVLEGNGLNVGKINRIFVAQRNISRSAYSLVVIGSRGKHRIKATDFRKYLGATRLPSVNFSLRKVDGKAVFEGEGTGHGVGMSQRGAYNMAERGFLYDEILAHYYKFVELNDYKKLGRLQPDIWKSKAKDLKGFTFH